MVAQGCIWRHCYGDDGHTSTQVGDGIDFPSTSTYFYDQRKRDPKGGHKGYL